LQFFWLTDFSGSMDGKKIATLNQAIREALPEVRQAVGGHPEVQVSMRAIRFADDAECHVGPQAVPIEQFVGPELTVAGGTATSQAIRLLTSELTVEQINRSNSSVIRGYQRIDDGQSDLVANGNHSSVRSDQVLRESAFSQV
jgi:uncharacterized protein YegL